MAPEASAAALRSEVTTQQHFVAGYSRNWRLQHADAISMLSL
jgi:hypothetical protein